MVELYLRMMTQQVIPHNVFHSQYSVPIPQRDSSSQILSLHNHSDIARQHHYLAHQISLQGKVDFRTRKVIVKVLGAQFVNKNIFAKMKIETHYKTTLF